MSEFEGEEYLVLYGWEPENDGDLRLVAGETVLVVEKNDHGWWNGIIHRENVPFKGYFPKNYVRVKSTTNSLPTPPPRPTHDNVEKLGEDLAKTNVTYSRKSMLRQGPAFSLKTLAAFDELMDFGVAVELELGSSHASTSAQTTYITNGMRVELKINALLWDGASSVVSEFASGNVSFTVGCGQVTKGLNTAMLRLRVGDSATITCSPSNAYGEAGNPPAVPPDSFIVYRITVLSASEKGTIPAAVGPAAILGSGISPTRRGNNVPFSKDEAGKEKRKSRIMLVYNATKENNTSSEAMVDANGVPISPPIQEDA